MPVVVFNLTRGFTTQKQNEDLLKEACKSYSKVLGSPMARVRASIVLREPELNAVAGDLVSKNNLHAPIFDFLVMEGRPLNEKQSLLTEFSQLLVDILGVDHDLIRGRCISVNPEEWIIGDTPADILRQKEIESRKAKV